MKTITKFIYFGFASLALACFTLSPTARAVVPPPDGGYPNFNTAEGQNALFNLTTGQWNTALGAFTLWKNTDGSFNTAVGTAALLLNIGDQTTGEGIQNTAIGAASLLVNTTGSNNTAVGVDALFNNTVDGNTALGSFALAANTTGGAPGTSNNGYTLGPNTAIGSGALRNNVDSSCNTAVGYNALNSLVHGNAFDPREGFNTAVGFEALANLNGQVPAFDSAYGYQALFNLTTGDGNLAAGFHAGYTFTSGIQNTFIGVSAGGFSFTSGDRNTFIGDFAGDGLTSGSYNIFIGDDQGPATPTENFHTYIRNINNTSVSGGGTDTVTIDLTTGLLGHLTSSGRYKEDIKPMDKASEALYRLRPVTYHYKKEIDKTQSLSFGLIAEEVAEVNPDLVAHNAQGQPESVHYEMVNAMLLNEFLKAHRKIEEQAVTIAQLKRELQATAANQQKQIEALTAGLQKVSAQLELNTSAPQTVLNNQ